MNIKLFNAGIVLSSHLCLLRNVKFLINLLCLLCLGQRHKQDQGPTLTNIILHLHMMTLETD
uniref:Uncharacterized protein n=1 Tax=Arion vulgaris TaxID=1028688 RepID=A0A0B6ZB07_9EUPU